MSSGNPVEIFSLYKITHDPNRLNQIHCEFRLGTKHFGLKFKFNNPDEPPTINSNKLLNICLYSVNKVHYIDMVRQVQQFKLDKKVMDEVQVIGVISR